MDQTAVLERVQLRRAALLRAEAVAAEILEPAQVIRFNLRGGNVAHLLKQHPRPHGIFKGGRRALVHPAQGGHSLGIALPAGEQLL